MSKSGTRKNLMQSDQVFTNISVNWRIPLIQICKLLIWKQMIRMGIGQKSPISFSP